MFISEVQNKNALATTFPHRAMTESARLRLFAVTPSAPHTVYLSVSAYEAIFLRMYTLHGVCRGQL